jgi:hypothetical protein
MIWNLIKQLFWCGVFHKPKLSMDLGYPDEPITEKDIGQEAVCAVCYATYEII